MKVTASVEMELSLTGATPEERRLEVRNLLYRLLDEVGCFVSDIQVEAGGTSFDALPEECQEIVNQWESLGYIEDRMEYDVEDIQQSLGITLEYATLLYNYLHS